MSRAQELILDLKAKGYSYARIGRELDRDSSLISQIARGKKPGSNLVSSLESVGKSEVKKPERRVTKSGEVAKVRRPKPQAEKAKRLLKDKSGRIKFAPSSAKESVFLSRLEKIAEAGGKVSFRVTTASGGTFHLYSKGGIFAQQAVYQALNWDAGAFDWLREKAQEQQGNGNSISNQIEIDEVVSVEIIAVYL